MESNLKVLLSDKRNKHKFIFLLNIIIVLVLLFGMIVVNSYNFSVKNADKKIKEKAKLNSVIINNKVGDIFNILHSTASMISKEDDIKSPDIMSKLKLISTRNGFDRMAVTTPDGMSYTDDKVTHDSSDRTYFIEGMKNNACVTEIEKSVVDGKPFVAFSCPIVKEQRVIGVLRVTVTKEYFKNMLNIESQTGSEDVFIIDKNGSIVLLNNDNVFNKILKGNKDNNSAVNELEKAVIAHKEISIKYKQGNTAMCAYSTPFSYNDWSIITTLSKSQANKDFHLIYLHSVIVPLFFVALLVVNLLYFKGSFKRFLAQNKVYNKEINIISSVPSLCLFWYDMDKKSVTFSDGFQEQIGCRACIENIPESLIDNDYIYSEHNEMLVDFIERINSGLRYNEAYLKIKKANSKFALFKVSSTTIYLEGKPVKAIGYLNEMENDKLNDSDISVNDSLTGLYNKLSIKTQVNEFIRKNQDSIGALMIVDIYNFKNINDKLGYSVGDAVIKEMAAQLRSLFRSSDVLGRTGDDEFAVFMKNVNSIDLLNSKINTIIDLAKNISLENTSIKVSVNIGVAMYPQDGDEFNELFKNSTTALEKAKTKGGGHFELYSEVKI